MCPAIRCLLSAVLLLTGIGETLAARVAAKDGLALVVDARGAVTGVSVGGRALPGPGAAGGFYLADVRDVPARETEVLLNPGFERGQDGWSVGADWAPDTTVAHAGTTSMRVSIPGAEKRSSGALAVEVAVSPNTPYRVSMWMRTEGSAPSFYVVQMDAAGNQHRDYPQVCISHARTRSDWFLQTTSFTTAFFCRKIRVYTNLWQQTGTAWIDDASVICLEDDYVTAQRPAMGSAKPAGDGIAFAAEHAGLRLNATCRPVGDALRVDGTVEDTTGEDRAVTLSFRLPVGGEGWTWFEDLRNAQPIEPGVRYGAARLVGERRTMGLYPFSAMGDGKSALALAVPMDMPRTFRLCYASGVGYFVQYEFGLTRAAKKHPGRADFGFTLYRVDPEWGFRSAAERYYRLFPAFFRKRVEGEGGAGFMVEESRLESPGHLPPAFAIFDWHKRDASAAYRRQMARLFPYTEFTGWWGWALGITPEEARQRPTPEEAWARVEKKAHADPPDKVAQCILNCVPFDREGKRRLHSQYVPEWGGYNYLCNPDPEIEGMGGKVNRFALTYEREVRHVDDYKADGMYLDCAFVFVTDNFRREHFQWADYPPAFDHASKKPVLPMAFSVYECAKAIADDMHARGKWVMSNYSVTNEPTDLFSIQFVDIIGNEMLWTWCTDAKLALQRTLAYQKTVSMSWQEAKNEWPAERVEREMKQAMFYGTFYALSGMSREVQERWFPLTRRLAAAGWQPVTLARGSTPAVAVERFGEAGRHNLHFALRNDTAEAATTRLRISDFGSWIAGAPGGAPAAGKGARPSVWLMRDSPTPVPLALSGGAIEVAVPAHDTVVLRVGSRRDLALDRLFEVPDLLERAARYRDALKEAGVAVTAPDYAAVQARVRKLEQDLRAGRVAPSAALAETRALWDALVEPRVGPATGKAEGWLKYLLEYHAKARRELGSAGELMDSLV